MLKRYYVVTPAYVSGGSPSSYYPPEDGCDVIEIEAKTKRDAKIRALPFLRQIGRGWLSQAEGNPFKGLKVYLVDSE